MKSLSVLLAIAALAAPALAQAPAELPVCSKEVRDRCIQGPAAQRRQAQEFKGGGRDNSATMTPRQAAAGMAKSQ
ncbi:hypothetical protein [Thermaurantiacus sp.]